MIMSRLVFLSITIVLSLLPVVAPLRRLSLRPESFGFAHGAPQPAPLVYRSNPQLLRVRWRLALFRPAWLLRRSLQWRQLRPSLDADADRANLELRLIKLLLKDRARLHPSPGNGGSWR
jgi:hypothetical protein